MQQLLRDGCDTFTVDLCHLCDCPEVAPALCFIYRQMCLQV